MRKKGILLITLGILGIIFVCLVDIIMGKPVNDITGPKSVIGLIIAIIFLVFGLRDLKKVPKK